MGTIINEITKYCKNAKKGDAIDKDELNDKLNSENDSILVVRDEENIGNNSKKDNINNNEINEKKQENGDLNKNNKNELNENKEKGVLNENYIINEENEKENGILYDNNSGNEDNEKEKIVLNKSNVINEDNKKENGILYDNNVRNEDNEEQKVVLNENYIINEDNKKENGLLNNNNVINEDNEKEKVVLNNNNTINEDNEKENGLLNNNNVINKDNKKENGILNDNNAINEDNEKEKAVLNNNNTINEDNEKENGLLNDNNVRNEDNEKEKVVLNNNNVINEDNKNNQKEILNDYKTILIGLNNIGATCYMNSTLQCLSNTEDLTYYFLNKFKYDQNNNNKIMSNAYYYLIVNLWNKENNNKSFSPDDFKEKLSQENPLFKGIAANDSKDLIQFLIERFHKELNIINNDNNFNNDYTQNDQLNEQKMKELFMNEFAINYNSIISDLFYGILEIKSQCQGCKYIKYNFQVYSFIEFPLEKVNQFCFNIGRKINNNNKNPDIDLYECFEYYRSQEIMTGDNRMYCNICNNNCDSLYETSLYSTPKYLIINLNRGRGAVYECNVIFSEILDLHDFVADKNGNINYELYAVICHIGPSSMSGHFVAYCKNRMDKKWYLYNDAFVTLCENNNEFQKGMPYILFYQNIIVA